MEEGREEGEQQGNRTLLPRYLPQRHWGPVQPLPVALLGLVGQSQPKDVRGLLVLCHKVLQVQASGVSPALSPAHPQGAC